LALTRGKKEELVREYGERLARAQVVVWTKFQGLTVPQMEELRGRLRSVGGEVIVVKNTLMRLALEQVKLPTDSEMMSGPCAVVFAYDDAGAATKAVTDFARANQGVLQIKGGLVGGKVVPAKQIRILSNLPSREVLLAQAIAGIQAPISGFVSTLAAIIRGLCNVLDARREQLEGVTG